MEVNSYVTNMNLQPVIIEVSSHPSVSESINKDSQLAIKHGEIIYADIREQ